MKPRRTALALLGLMGVLAIINAVLGNIVASLLQGVLGDHTWVVVVPFIAIAALLLGFELRGQLQARSDDRRLASHPRDRETMLKRVRTFWITGVLQPSLSHEVLIDLGLAERTEAVVRPLDLLVQHADGADRLLPPETHILDVFDMSDRTLLILGAPGAGKTTLLLELAEELLARATHDPDHPIPVVFRLSSWAAGRRPLADWLVDALSKQYDVPRRIGQSWVDADEILPLLDGLDAVAPEYRNACVEAINTFRRDHGLLPLAVCSRIDDYNTLTARLRLQEALVVQPLTHEQVESYLTQVGAPLVAVRQALQEDPTLWELLDTPLMLHIMSQTYAGQSVGDLRMPGTVDARRQQLFAAYVERMFQLQEEPPTTFVNRPCVGWPGWPGRWGSIARASSISNECNRTGSHQGSAGSRRTGCGWWLS